MSAPGSFVDSGRVRRNFARAARTYDGVAVLQREVGSRMLERLEYVKIDPARILDIGCGTGASMTALSERYPKAQTVGADFSEPMLRAGLSQRGRLRLMLPFIRGSRNRLVGANATALPFKGDSFGLSWSNLMLHWLDDPVPALREMHRVLEVGGLLMFSTLGPDTLKELRSCFADGYEHTQRFTDMHDYGDMLVACGFSDPVMDVEVLTATYQSLDDLFRDLRRGGAGCAMRHSRHGLMGRQTWRSACGAYERLARDGRLAATFEVVYGHAWKAPATKTADGRSIVHFDPKGRRP